MGAGGGEPRAEGGLSPFVGLPKLNQTKQQETI